MYKRPQAKYGWIDTVGLDDANFDDQETFKDILRFIGKKHALKKYDQFTLNTSCFWGRTGSNITPVVQFHEIFVTEVVIFFVKTKISSNQNLEIGLPNTGSSITPIKYFAFSPYIDENYMTSLEAIIWNVNPNVRCDALLTNQAKLINLFAPQEIWNNVIIIVKQSLNPDDDGRGKLKLF